MYRPVIVLLFSLLVSGFTYATPIEFDLRDSVIESLDESASFSLTQDGITATFSTPNGVLNRTSSGFGVNATGGGDDTDAIDSGAGITESIEIMFAEAISLSGITVSGFGSSDLGELKIGTNIQSITSSGSLGAGDLAVSAGDIISIGFIAGNGFSLDRITVSNAVMESPSTSVPEPGTLWLLLGTSLVLLRKGTVNN